MAGEPTKMTYTEFKGSFNTVDEFRKAFGKLPEEQARMLVFAENQPAFIKAAMMTTWQDSRREYLEGSSKKA